MPDTQPRRRRITKPAPTVMAALLALAVLFVTFFGVLDGMPSWAKGIFQFTGTAGGIWLGYLLQKRDAETRGKSRAGAARRQLVALAETLNITLEFIADRRLTLADGTTVQGTKQDADSSLAGIDTSLRGILRQTNAAVENWDFEEPPKTGHLPAEQSAANPSDADVRPT